MNRHRDKHRQQDASHKNNVFIDRERNSRCIIITDLETSKLSTKKAFSCCNAILETGPAAPR
jgi:hypothetical protein